MGGSVNAISSAILSAEPELAGALPHLPDPCKGVRCLGYQYFSDRLGLLRSINLRLLDRYQAHAGQRLNFFPFSLRFWPAGRNHPLAQ